MAQSGQLVDETSVDQEADDRQEERLPQAGHPATDHHILDQRQENTSERKNRGDHRHAHRDVSERELPAELGGAADTVQGRWEDWTRTRGAPTRHRRASFWGGTLIPEELMTAPVPSVTRLSGACPDPWFCVPASRRVCLYREVVRLRYVREAREKQWACRFRLVVDAD